MPRQGRRAFGARGVPLRRLEPRDNVGSGGVVIGRSRVPCRTVAGARAPFGHARPADRVIRDCARSTDLARHQLVGRDGIEPPTPGFSVLSSESRKCPQLLAT